MRFKRVLNSSNGMKHTNFMVKYFHVCFFRIAFLSLENGNDVIFKIEFHFTVGRMVLTSKVGGVSSTPNVIQKKLDLKANTDFELKLYFDPSGYRVGV